MTFLWALLDKGYARANPGLHRIRLCNQSVVHATISAEAPRIRLRDREERVTNLWGELAALNERLGGGDPVATRKKIDYLRCGCQGHMLVNHICP